MSSSTSEKCATYINCAPKFDSNNNRLPALWVEATCISTESVNVSQNKTTDPPCRGENSQVESVESTNTTGDSQLELRDPNMELIADSIFCKAFNCEPMEVFYAKVVGPLTEVFGVTLPIISQPNLTGVVICGVPDANDTRDNAGKNFSWSVSRTQGQPETIKWEDYTGGDGLSQDPFVLDDDL